MRKGLSFFFTLVTLYTAAQDQTIQSLKSESNRNVSPTDTSKRVWKVGGLLNLNVAQSSLSNWAAGGDNFVLAINAYSNMHAFYRRGKNTWDNNVDINLGYIRTSSLGNRKNDDRVDLVSKYGYSVSNQLSTSFLFNFRSQFFNGYTFPNDTTKVYASSGFAPAYMLFSPGFDYHPIKNFSLFFSPITSRLIIVGSPALQDRGAYGVDTGHYAINELGSFATVNYFIDLSSNLNYRGRIDLFSNYRHNPQNVDMYFTNALTIKIYRALTAIWTVDMIYDDDVRIFGKTANQPRLQVKSQIGIGLSLKGGS